MFAAYQPPLVPHTITVTLMYGDSGPWNLVAELRLGMHFREASTKGCSQQAESVRGVAHRKPFKAPAHRPTTRRIVNLHAHDQSKNARPMPCLSVCFLMSQTATDSQDKGDRGRQKSTANNPK